MKILTGFTNQPKQDMSFVLADGSTVSLFIEYRPQQLGWFADFSWQDWTVNGLRLTASPNILVKWDRILPFGVAIITKNQVEPLNPDDFADGTATVWLLNAADVETVNETAFIGF